MLSTFAPAKINLYLHVTGRREDGYHFLDSLVAFADVGDRLTLTPSPDFSFSTTGPMAPALSATKDEDNLVVRAARCLAESVGGDMNFHLTLQKNLPTASGIGGGSTDAAATLRLLARHWGLAPTDPRLFSIAASLGQDVPCCLEAAPCYFEGIGDTTRPGPSLPPCSILLINPRKALPTPAVFKARTGAFSPPAPFDHQPETPHDLAAMLSSRHNDLTQAALSLEPSIGEVLSSLAASEGCLLSRMSGSGATCFGLFSDRSACRAAAAHLLEKNPGWWIAPAFLPFRPGDDW